MTNLLKHTLTICAALALSAIAFGALAVTPARAETGFICDDLGNQSFGAMTASGGVANIYQNNQTGSTFCHILIHDGTYSVDPALIGVESLLALKPTQAVDIFGMMSDGVPAISFRTPIRTCLRGSGTVFFLSAGDSGARQVTTLFGWEATPGYTCADVFSAGTVVLATPPPPPPPDPSTDPNVAGDVTAVTELTNCTVTTTYGVFLRREPSLTARIRFQFKAGVELPATGRSGSWFRVDFNKRPGWINAAFVTPEGDCGG